MTSRLTDTGGVGVKRDVYRDASVESDGGEILVEEGFEEDDLVALLEEGDEDRVLAWTRGSEGIGMEIT